MYSLYFSDVLRRLPFLLGGGVTVFLLCMTSMGLGFLIGVAGALASLSNSRVARKLARGYVELMRNTPLLVQAYLIYFGLPELGIPVESYPAALIALTINNGAYLTEIIRAGMEAVHKSEVEAALALGMSFPAALRYIIIPHVFKIIYYPLCNQLIAIILGSSVFSLIGAAEITYRARIIEAETFRAFEVYIVLMIVYVATTFLATILLRLIGQKVFKLRLQGI